MKSSIIKSIHFTNKHVYKGIKLNTHSFSEFKDTDLIDEIYNAQSEDDIHRVCVKLRYFFGFDYFNILIFFPSPNSIPFTYFMLEHGNAWTSYYEKHDLIYSDLRIPYSMSQFTPSFWGNGPSANLTNQKLLSVANAKQLDTLNLAYDFGISRLSSFPLHGTNGELGALRLVHDKEGAPTPTIEMLNAQIAHISLLSYYIYESLVKLIKVNHRTRLPSIHLTEREEEVLKWVASGKSNYAISTVLNISENTVSKHMKNIHRKLGVKSRQHAVAKAITSNLISV